MLPREWPADSSQCPAATATVLLTVVSAVILYMVAVATARRFGLVRLKTPMRVAELEEAVETNLVTVGSHTHSHVSLARATKRLEEMRRSKELIEDRLSIACRQFAYPWAVGSDQADRAARRLFDTIAWDACRTNRRGHIDRHRLGRTPVLRNDGRLFFRAKVRGRLDGEQHVYRALRRGPWRSP